jgi:hypothetical protein
MLESEVPPCRTITLDGGQFVAALSAAVGGGAEFEEAEPAVASPPVAGVLTQLAEATRFLCRPFLPVLGGVCPEEVFSGAVGEGVAVVGGWDGVDGFCAGAAPP